MHLGRLVFQTVDHRKLYIWLKNTRNFLKFKKFELFYCPPQQKSWFLLLFPLNCTTISSSPDQQSPWNQTPEFFSDKKVSHLKWQLFTTVKLHFLLLLQRLKNCSIGLPSTSSVPCWIFHMYVLKRLSGYPVPISTANRSSNCCHHGYSSPTAVSWALWGWSNYPPSLKGLSYRYLDLFSPTL